VLGLLSLWNQPALALDPQKVIGQYVLDAWTSADGLPQNTVIAVAQTLDGYLWLGTEGGLVRFDGVSFTVFDRTNTPEIKNNIILALHADKDGSLWIGTFGGGLTRLKDGQFTSFTRNDGLAHDIVRAFFEDKEGSLWIATDGGGLNRLRNGRFTSFTTKDGLSNNKVMVIYQDREGNLWIGTYHGGLNKFRDGKFTNFTTKDGLCDDSIWTINEDSQGNLWIGTEKGLNRLKDGKFASFTKRDGLSSDIIKKVYEDTEGNLWIGTFGGGLNRLKDGKFTSFTATDGLSNNIVRTIYEDREGSLWIGTEGGGLNRLRDGKFTCVSTKQILSNDLTSAIFEDRQGNLWIGTFGGGLNRIKDSQVTSFTTRQGLSNDFVISIFEDSKGSLWIGTYGGGLNRFKDGKFTHFTTRQGLSNDYVFSTIEDKQGAVWFSTSGSGLSRFREGKFTSIVVNDGLSNVFKIYEDRQGSLWMGTSFGLSVLKNGQLSSFTTNDGLSDNNIRSVYEDNEGNLWIVGDGGLNRLKNGKFTSFTGKDGLFDGAALAVVEDYDNNLWITSHKGIFRASRTQLNDFADGKTSSITGETYSIADGLKTNECNFGSPAAFRSRDGRLWFATVKGVAMVDPNHIKLNTLQPPTAIEKVVIDGNAFSPRTNIEAPPGGGKLEFQFTALSFVAPKKVRFKYKLEGFDENWIDAGTSRTATYTNIAPGKYRFRVIACNNDGLWNETGASFGFYLRPHFYQTYWFYTSIVVGVLLLGLTFHRLRIRTLENRKTELESLVAGRTRDLLETTRQLEEANRRQADYVSGVSHELKTPLTLIRLYGETLLYGDEFSPEGRRGFYQIITRESERLTRLVDNVLDFSRIDRGVKRYSFQEGDLAPVVSETVEVYARHLRRAGFTVEVSLISDLPPVRFDEASLAEVIFNLLDNAAKYCNQKKHICVRIRKETDHVVLEIEDQGVGIAQSEQEKIFEQFYRSASSADKGGYGLGLFLVKEIMAAHGGAIEVKSQVGHGSTFRLVFPLSKEGLIEKVSSHPSSSH
jgi:ligand-binding sensor domain-containing protein/signal transduction histidine kinase